MKEERTASTHLKQPHHEQDQWNETVRNEQRSLHTLCFCRVGLCIFPSPGLSPSRSRNSRLSSQHRYSRQGKKKQILAKESSFANSFLLQLKYNCPKAKHILIMMWDLLVTKPLAVGCQAPGFVCLFCNFLCSHE